MQDFALKSVPFGTEGIIAIEFLRRLFLNFVPDTLFGHLFRNDDLASKRLHPQQECALGDTKFQNKVEKTLGRPARLRNRGRPRCQDNPPDGA